MRATSIQPGESTDVVLDLPMGMHAGMEGPHLFEIQVPVITKAETAVLTLHWRAHFK